MPLRYLMAPVTALLFALPQSLPADPPPWAPAHGWRAKHDRDYGECETEYEYKYKYKKGKHKEKYKTKHKGKCRDRGVHEHVHVYHDPDHYQRHSEAVGIPRGLCRKDIVGGLVGAAAGGYLGSKVGKGTGQLAATAAGTVLGYLVGSSLGRYMDDVDQNCVGQVLERASDRQTVAWADGTRDSRYAVTPTRTFRAGERHCRDYVLDAVIDGRQGSVTGTACRNPDGTWTRG